MTTRTRSDIGRAARAKGIRAELHLAAYLRNNGWPHAERKTDNGWKTTTRENPDHGDIRGTPGITWQVKAITNMTATQITEALKDTQNQAVADGTDYALLVIRRNRKRNPAHWWTWLPIGDLATLYNGTQTIATPDGTTTAPTRTELQHLIPLLHKNGYGTP